MNYYERHLGDYARDTGHLSPLEHGVYNLLIDRYYATETPIPADQAHRICRARTKEEREAVDVVLEEFFSLEDGAYSHRRIEEEIEKARARIDNSRANGRRGGRPRKNPVGSENETQKEPSGFSPGFDTETQTKAHQTPDTKHQTPEKEQKQKRAAGAAPADLFPGVDSGVVSDFLALRAKHRAPVTETAVAGLRREAEAAGYSLEQALRTCCERGWRGFKAEWVARDGAGNVRPFPGRPAAKPGSQPEVLPELTA